MMENYRGTAAIINLSNLQKNLVYLRNKRGDHRFICPMVKANAYGHGDIQVAKKLEELQVSALGVGLIEEGIRLRQSGVSCPILVFANFDRQGLDQILQYRLTPMVFTTGQLDLIDQLSHSPLSIHLKFETGMNRLGFQPDQVSEVLQRISNKVHVEGVCSHLVQGKDISSEASRSLVQIDEFRKILDAFPGAIGHILNSEGLLASSSSAVPDELGSRPGIALYGADVEMQEGLLPVMELKSVVSTSQYICKGESVSYSGTWIAPRDSVILVVPVGYADGYRRILSNRGFALFRGERVPVVGTVCMDYLLLDATQVVGNDPPKSGEEIVLFGKQGDNIIFVDEVAKWADTIPYEILAGVGIRVPRVFI